MRIAIFGSGYVGLVTGACLADGGHHVTCIDVDRTRVDMLRSGGCPIWEPGLEDMIRANTAQGRLNFTDDAAEGLRDARVAFIAVGTPQSPDGSADLTYVDAVARDIGTGTDRQIAIRSYAEQLVCEANAVLLAEGDHLSLDDEVGAEELAFNIRYRGRAARVSLMYADHMAYGQIVGDGIEASEPRELDGPEALPDLLLLLLMESGLTHAPHAR